MRTTVNLLLPCPVYLTHTMEYYAATRQNEILPLVTTEMDPEDIKWDKPEKDKYCTMSLHIA